MIRFSDAGFDETISFDQAYSFDSVASGICSPGAFELKCTSTNDNGLTTEYSIIENTVGVNTSTFCAMFIYDAVKDGGVNPSIRFRERPEFDG